MEGNMFCYQCQEAAKGIGCTLKGVCGKNDTTARAMDLLLFVVRGVSIVSTALRKQKKCLIANGLILLLPTLCFVP